MLIVWRAATLDSHRPLFRNVFLEDLHQAGFADASLPAQQHNLAFSAFALSQRLRSTPTSSRPTRGVNPLLTATSKRLWAPLSRTARYSGSGARSPFTS